MSRCILSSTLFLVGTSYIGDFIHGQSSYSSYIVCVVLAVVFSVSCSCWLWLCDSDDFAGNPCDWRADDRISDQTGFWDASVDGLGTLTRLNSIADIVKCFGYNITLAWAHVSQSNETLMANHGAWIISGRPIGLNHRTQNLIDIRLWVLTITQQFAWVRASFCKSLYYKLLYSNHVFLSIISIIMKLKDASIKVCIGALLP